MIQPSDNATNQTEEFELKKEHLKALENVISIASFKI